MPLVCNLKKIFARIPPFWATWKPTSLHQVLDSTALGLGGCPRPGVYISSETLATALENKSRQQVG